MTKAYWVAHVEIDDAEAYEAYRQANALPFARYGARFLVRGGEQQVVEGSAKSRTVVIEFADLETARACYHSPEYQAAKALREPVSRADVMIVAGWDAA
ncbi:uncharacterized protein (DUF1330 family) [Gemmobacter caeni]|jgi:uncharacterized protein (DUF1330 family)|uniref:Uncharacterized protein (DUF1330 family) n=2 Tax=Gemmobacter TaxID=204456 RepID=A0A2T6AVW0_9RHOB|nr:MULTISPECIES: DUF1330 domain-containing protein [Gemmobacter]PTX47958.1 uncharacterized protein (DUF1330 family) [Gemmobacter caeni]TWI97320.1 uncharacterized protein (DUF1330 family) [Gemmobacter caeni]GHC30547.1 hypothetical protein GCM10007291_34010 [Gemmobacter nanjingensis]